MARPKEENIRDKVLPIVRMTEQEMDKVNRNYNEAKKYGFRTKSEFIRFMLTKKSGKIFKELEEKKEVIDRIDYREYVYHLKKIGTNLNQLMRVVNKENGTAGMNEKDKKKLIELLSEIKNIS